LRSAKVGVVAAESALAAAQLNVRRAGLKAPFNAFVQRAMADPGQLVNAQSQIATLVGTDSFWVQVSVPI
jgi:multidrug resistance efflux pump